MRNRSLFVVGLGMEILFLRFLFLSPILPSRLNQVFGLLFLAFLLYLFAVKCLPGLRGGEIAIIAFALLFRLTLFFVPPFASDDIYRYVWDGRVQNAGMNPYLYPPDAPELTFLKDGNFPGINHKSIRTIYPPLSEIVFRAAARIRPGIWPQKLAFLLFDISTIGLLFFYLRWSGRSPHGVLIYAWNPLVLLEFSSSGHNDSMGIFFLMLGIFLLQKSQARTAMAALAASFLAKFSSVLLLPWIIWRSSPRRALWLFLCVSFAGYLPYMGGLAPVKRATALFEGPARYAQDWYFNASLYALVSKICDSGAAAKAILFGGLVLAAFFLARSLNNALAYAALAVVGALLVSPVVHPWYVCWLVPFLCFYPLWAGVLWTGLVGLSYAVLPWYLRTHMWELPVWVPWIEYGLVFSVLAWELVRKRRHSEAKPKNLFGTARSFAIAQDDGCR